MRHALHSAAFRSSDATIAPSASLAAFLLDPTRLSRRGNDVGNGCSSPLEAAAGRIGIDGHLKSRRMDRNERRCGVEKRGMSWADAIGGTLEIPIKNRYSIVSRVPLRTTIQTSGLPTKSRYPFLRSE